MSGFKWKHFQGEIILGCVRWYYQPRLGESWKVYETYVKVKGKWKYLYRAITKSGKTLDFYLSSTRKTKAAKRFLGKMLHRMKDYKNLIQSILIKPKLWPGNPGIKRGRSLK